MSTATELGVLVVDDDYRVASVHAGFVERVPGFTVVGLAHTAVDARLRAHELRPDLVLLDLYLPDGDGLDVLRDLFEDENPPTALIISAANDASSLRRAVQLGAAHYLVKPFRFADLQARLEAVADARHRLLRWPDEPTQADIDRLFEALRPTPDVLSEPVSDHLAPTLRLVLRTVAESGEPLSAADVSHRLGVSRATAQRCLAQLEQSRMLALQLRYGSAGRPEHRYTLRRA